MSGVLPDRAIDAYRRDGFWFPWRIMPAAEAGRIADRFLAFTRGEAVRRYPDPQNQLYLLKAHLIFRWSDEICHSPALLDAVESFIGPDIMVWSSGVFWKPPHSGAHVSWHQDSTNYELDGADAVVRAWVALTPATLENGTMRFVPGAQRLGQIPHRDLKRDGELLSRGETIVLAIDEARTVPVLIDAGEVSFHHLHAPHGSGPNRSDRPRVNYVITFVAPHVRPKVGPDSAVLARGRDRHGHLEHEPRPEADLAPAAMRAHRHYLTMRNAILYRGSTPPAPPPHPV
jgi:ectoine hydroxylase-related dioxygenase (phytanoyl-CoA dioxygenase family)